MSHDKRRFLNKQRALTAVTRAEKRTGFQHKLRHCRECGEYHVSRVLVDSKPVKTNTRNLIPRVTRLTR